MANRIKNNNEYHKTMGKIYDIIAIPANSITMRLKYELIRLSLEILHFTLPKNLIISRRAIETPHGDLEDIEFPDLQFPYYKDLNNFVIKIIDSSHCFVFDNQLKNIPKINFGYNEHRVNEYNGFLCVCDDDNRYKIEDSYSFGRNIRTTIIVENFLDIDMCIYLKNILKFSIVPNRDIYKYKKLYDQFTYVNLHYTQFLTSHQNIILALFEKNPEISECLLIYMKIIEDHSNLTLITAIMSAIIPAIRKKKINLVCISYIFDYLYPIELKVLLFKDFEKTCYLLCRNDS